MYMYFYTLGQRKKAKSTVSSSSTTTSSQISIVRIQRVLEDLQNNHTRNSTTQNYLSIWRHFNKFLIRLDTNIKTCWEDKAALFGAHLADKGIKSTTLRSYFSAIKNILKRDGYPWDNKKVLLSTLIKGCKLKNDTVTVRMPIQRKLLEMLIFEMQKMFKIQPYLNTMYTALYLIMYYGLMRVGEIALSEHTVKAVNVHVGSNKDKILLVLYSSKTHGKESAPQKIKISAIPNTVNKNKQVDRFFCPFRATRDYLRIRGPCYTEEEPFFILSDRSPVEMEMVRETLKKAIENVGLKAELYNCHSLRSGRATEMAKFNYSIEQIRESGRWRSNAVYNYLKP